MVIEEILPKNLTDEHYELLLQADPSREMINSYIDRSHCFEILSPKLIAIIVLLPTHPKTLEIVNISVIHSEQGKGIGQYLLQFAQKFAQTNNFDCLEIGTGSTSFKQLYLYQSYGFRICDIYHNFFPYHYKEEIIENKLHLQDMLRLRLILK
ncbi:GNAT family N-acetyltransferase [Melissococcus plutonius]|uniref:GNAT family N-acetyltransferase n=1 Tax=Melissococcus plutonius TaxID=33970 RepID=UPI000F7BC220|nr:GNAT family N-acetyltransferase [Melissococcus plutonius]BBD15804.1 acetyltransferase, GNAT family [Melissococcus plutonius]